MGLKTTTRFKIHIYNIYNAVPLLYHFAFSSRFFSRWLLSITHEPVCWLYKKLARVIFPHRMLMNDEVYWKPSRFRENLDVISKFLTNAEKQWHTSRKYGRGSLKISAFLLSWAESSHWVSESKWETSEDCPGEISDSLFTVVHGLYRYTHTVMNIFC